MVSDFILQCFEQLKRARAELEKATADRVKAQAVENSWYKTAEGLQRTIEAAKDRGEEVPDLNAPPTSVKVAGEIFSKELIGDTEFARRVIKNSQGITPVEIRRMAQVEGRTFPANYPHTILSKMKRRKEIYEKEGKYYYGKAATQTAGGDL